MNDMDSNADHRARLVVVERVQEELKSQFTALSTDVKHQIGSLAAEMRQSSAQLSESLQKFVQSQAQQPRPIPFKEIIATAVATAALVSYGLAFIDSRITSAIEIAKGKDIATHAVMQHRIEQIDKKVNPTVQLVRPVQ